MKGRPATQIEIEAMGAICKLQDELHETQQVIRRTISFLKEKAAEANQVHEDYLAACGKWQKSQKGKKPIPPIALPVAAECMLIATKMLKKTLPKAKSELIEEQEQKVKQLETGT